MTARAEQIYDALISRCLTLAIGSSPLPVAYPEQDPAFVAPEDGKYLLVDDFPNRPRWEGVTSGRLDQGLLQITVVWPRNQGLHAPRAAADAVAAHFAKETVMSSGGVTVKVSAEPWAAKPLTESDRVTVPITIPWTA